MADKTTTIKFVPENEKKGNAIIARAKAMTCKLQITFRGNCKLIFDIKLGLLSLIKKDKNLHICPFEDISNNTVDCQIKQAACATHCSPEQHFLSLIWRLHNANYYTGTIVISHYQKAGSSSLTRCVR